VLVAGLADVAAIDAGGGHTCALTEAGLLYCWGDGEFGQTGNRDTVSATPAHVLGL
jgi:alpha-tubulin suppressor-like RCC1 family protein